MAVRPDPAIPEDAATDEHFVQNVVSSSHEVKASEDIVTATGAKLIAKGARDDAKVRERLISPSWPSRWSSRWRSPARSRRRRCAR
jgi:hypothetical protein